MEGPKNVAVIGCGLTGLGLALALNNQSIPCTVYDLRDSPLDIGGTVTLSPNALRILDALGVWQLMRHQGRAYQNIYFRSQDETPIDEVEYGNERKYGYPAFRISRHALINALLSKASEKNIRVEWGKKFVRVLSESGNKVKWEFADGTVGEATSLVGADGIHSRVRKYLYPEIEPQFAGHIAVTAPALTSKLNIPEGCQLPVTLMSRDHNAVMLLPFQPDGSEVVVAKQTLHSDLGRDGWKSLIDNQEWCIGFLREDAEKFPPYVATAVANLMPEKLNVWPFYVVPKLDAWVSEQGSVAILGDAAHAIPPSTGQGANQGFEDAYTYALILAQCPLEKLGATLRRWKIGRQERIDRLLELADWMNKRRLPINMNGGGPDAVHEKVDLDWLFKPDFDRMVKHWLSS